jgi:hypothetical protein
MCIKQKHVVLCFGNAACMAYRKIAEGDRLFGSNKVVIQLCHFSDRGISNFFGKIGKGRKLVFSEKLNLVAWYVNSCYGKGGFFSIDKFYQAVSPLIQSEIMEGKEFDIAWALILRPGQRFLKTGEEIQRFLEGYLSHGSFQAEYVRYYMILIYSRFYDFGESSDGYQEYIMKVFRNICLEDPSESPKAAASVPLPREN